MSSTLTLSQQVERFVRTKTNQQTRKWYTNYLQPLVTYFGPQRTPDSISFADAEDYWLQLQSRNRAWETHPNKPTQRRRLSPTTLQNYLRATRSFWRYLHRQRLVEDNVFAHLSAPKDSRPMQMKAIDPDDLQAIWQTARRTSARDYAIITVVATCGLRAGELISMDTQRLDIQQGVAWVEGKRGWRKIFLGQASVEAIANYLPERPLNAPTALWLSVTGQPLTSDGVRQMVERLARKAKVKGRYNLHSFRHRTAQAWLDKGVNAEVVAQALGHANVSITLAIYGNQDEKRVRKAMQEMEMSVFSQSK